MCKTKLSMQREKHGLDCLADTATVILVNNLSLEVTDVGFSVSSLETAETYLTC